MRILLIEPNRVLAKTYGQWLRGQGHEVLLATGAQSAIHAADSKKPDIVLLELQLPSHNGVDFLYEFRSYGEWQDVPIILHTMVPTNSLKLDADAFRQFGIAAYLYKPTTTLLTLSRVLNEFAVPVGN